MQVAGPTGKCKGSLSNSYEHGVFQSVGNRWSTSSFIVEGIFTAPKNVNKLVETFVHESV
jgi:hypothetical protein